MSRGTVVGINCRGVEYDDKDMTIAGLQAKISVFMTGMAMTARLLHNLSQGGVIVDQEFVKDIIKRADKAQLSVSPDDLYDSSKLNLN
jgi:hypothetical protein